LVEAVLDNLRPSFTIFDPEGAFDVMATVPVVVIVEELGDHVLILSPARS